MAAAVPLVLGAVSAASSVKQAKDARKSQKESLAQQERLAKASQSQTTRDPIDLTRRRRRRGSTPGFADAGAASALSNPGGSTLLGQ